MGQYEQSKILYNLSSRKMRRWGQKEIWNYPWKSFKFDENYKATDPGISTNPKKFKHITKTNKQIKPFQDTSQSNCWKAAIKRNNCSCRGKQLLDSWIKLRIHTDFLSEIYKPEDNRMISLTCWKENRHSILNSIINENNLQKKVEIETFSENSLPADIHYKKC